MKKLLFVFALALLSTTFVSAQKFGYVDTDKILGAMDEYQAAQTEIEQQSQRWQQELETMHQNVETLYKNYQAEKVLLAEDIRRQREEEIMEAERVAKEFKKAKFGYEGELYKIQDDKIRPVQDKVFQAIEEVAKERRLDFILDKATNTGILYSNAAFDRTDDVMIKLGLKK